MAVRRILQLGDPLLREISSPIEPRSAAGILRDLEDTLSEFRRSHGFGRAISAVQIGSLSRVIFMEVDGTRYELVNPEYIQLSDEKFTLWDDCFSFSDLMVLVERHRALRLRFQNGDGATCEIAAEGPLAELIQHEMDHLDGVLAVDRAIDAVSLCTRDEWQRRYRDVETMVER